MKLQNINCEYIRILSGAYKKGYVGNTIKGIELISTINDGTPVSQSIEFSTLSKSWSISIAFNALTKISQLYLKNMITGLTFKLLPDNTKVSVTTTNLTMIKSLVAQKLQSDFSITGVEQTYQIIDGEILKITFKRLPDNLSLHSIVTLETSAEVQKVKYSTYVDSGDIIFNGDDLLIKPSFYDLTAFTDGIYKVTLKIIDNNNVVTREETCYFMDCTISGALISTVEVEECNESDVRTLMLHYALRVASNRDCDCDEMQKIFDFLNKHIDTSNTDPCGC